MSLSRWEFNLVRHKYGWGWKVFNNTLQPPTPLTFILTASWLNANRLSFVSQSSYWGKKKGKTACPSHRSSQSKHPQETVQTVACWKRKPWQETTVFWGEEKLLEAGYWGAARRKTAWFGDLESWRCAGLSAYSRGLKGQSFLSKPCSSPGVSILAT